MVFLPQSSAVCSTEKLSRLIESCLILYEIREKENAASRRRREIAPAAVYVRFRERHDKADEKPFFRLQDRLSFDILKRSVADSQYVVLAHKWKSSAHDVKKTLTFLIAPVSVVSMTPAACGICETATPAEKQTGKRSLDQISPGERFLRAPTAASVSIAQIESSVWSAI